VLGSHKVVEWVVGGEGQESAAHHTAALLQQVQPGEEEEGGRRHDGRKHLWMKWNVI